MFNTVMSRKDLCRKCIERILDKKITDITIPESEKWIAPDIDAKSIRLDVYCEEPDGTKMYNIELQNGMNCDLPRRSRYYQSLMDIDSLEKGHDYTELPQSFVIFICTFDPYEMSRHLYTFENRCIQDENLKLNDGATKIFLNTKGTLDDIPKPLKMFLDYIDKGVVTDDYTKELEDAVVEIRADKRWRKRIMTLEQYAKEQAKEAAKEAAIDMKTRINKLNTYLIKAGRLEELEASFEDEELQEKLLKEYNLID